MQFSIHFVLLIRQELHEVGRALQNARFAQLFTARVRYQRFEGLKAGVDALHATPLVAVGDGSPLSLVIFKECGVVAAQAALVNAMMRAMIRRLITTIVVIIR